MLIQHYRTTVLCLIEEVLTFAMLSKLSCSQFFGAFQVIIQQKLMCKFTLGFIDYVKHMQLKLACRQPMAWAGIMVQ